MHGFGKPRQRGKKVFSLFRGSGPHSWRVKVFGMDIDVGQSFGGHEDRKAEGELGRWFVFRNESRRGIKKLSNAHARVWKPAPEGNLFPRAVILSFTNNTHESAFQLLRQPVFLLKLMPPVSICLIC
jgi:hypothetical protein